MVDHVKDNFKPSSYMTDSLLTRLTSIGVSPDAQVSNLARSGQLGTGIRFTKLDGATPAVFTPTVGVVLSVPTMWDPWPEMQDMLRALMETHAKSITGIDFSYSLETGDTPVGFDGQTMKVPTRTTRSAVNPSATFQEYPGMPVYNLFRTWMFDIFHPDTGSSLLPAIQDDAKEIPGWYMSAYSMSMIFIQYDPSGLPDRIYDAAIITNMFPTEIGEIGFERNIGTSQLRERSISFAGIVQHNENTRELGYQVAKMLQIHKINYQFALPGLAGTAEVDNAMQERLRSFGGLEYETGSTANGAVRVGQDDTNSSIGHDPTGAVDQFRLVGHGEFHHENQDATRGSDLYRGDGGIFDRTSSGSTASSVFGKTGADEPSTK